jgi:UDP-N-acetylmuramate dehydrogenase
MLQIEKNHDLTPYTTLRIGAAAEFFAVIKNKADLLEALTWAKERQQPIFILGGGSNVLITKKVKGLVLKNEITGCHVLKSSKNYTWLEAKSGESWSKLVNFSVQQKLYGLENLFLIYGTVGAAPVQNIGAYGVEFKDVFDHLVAIDLRTGRDKIFSLADCHFAYRDSIFKRRAKGRYFIYSVVVKLRRQAVLKLDYGTIREELTKRRIKQPSLAEVIKVIQFIRNSKLPNPVVLPNAGSFFKNPEISQAQFKLLSLTYPDMPKFIISRSKVKIPAGWLIEQTGFKGQRLGSVGMHAQQALVLVNYGQAQPREVLALVRKISQAVKRQFAIDLESEVNII